MILIISTSSPIASIAWVKGGQIIYEASREAARTASQAVIEMVGESYIPLVAAEGFVSDLGPGSLTGVKVGVTLAKTWGFAFAVKTGGISAFDLVSVSEPVIISPRRGEFLVRLPGGSPVVMTNEELDLAGLVFDPGHRPIPLASRGADLVDKIDWMTAGELLPLYLSGPLISTAKKPLTLVEPQQK